jgi:hypothetical protein
MMASFNPKRMLNRNELKQIKKSRTRIDGKKVLTDDVKKLKSLKVSPDLSEEEKIQFYREPIWIEYYIPKESRFAQEIKYLYIILVDPIPREGKDEILRKAMEEDKWIDLLELSKGSAHQAKLIKKSYTNFQSILETMSDQVSQFISTGDAEYLRTVVYLTETLMLYEPTIAALEVIGEFAIYNLNWLIRKLNVGKIDFSLEDRTILLLIKRRNDYWEENKLAEDEDFELFAALFFEQAYPNRGALELDSQDLL